MMRSFRSERYFKGNMSRQIRSEDLKSEFGNEMEEAMFAIQQGRDREAACHAARADLLKELIEVLEEGVDAPEPDSGISSDN